MTERIKNHLRKEAYRFKNTKALVWVIDDLGKRLLLLYRTEEIADDLSQLALDTQKNQLQNECPFDVRTA